MNGAAFWFGGSGRGGYPDVSKFHPAGSKLGGAYGKIEWGKVIPPNFTVQYASHMSYYESGNHDLYFLNKLDWGKLTEIGDYNFTAQSRFIYRGSTNELILPELTKIGSNCFNKDTYFFSDILKKITCPKLVSIGNSCFRDMTFNPYLIFIADELKTVGSYSFCNLKNFSNDKFYGFNINFPKLESIDANSLRSLNPINNIDLIALRDFRENVLTQITPANGAFGYGSNLSPSLLDVLKTRLPAISRWVKRN